MERDRIDLTDPTIDVRKDVSAESAGKHRRVIDVSSHRDLLAAFDEDERVMEALLAALPPVDEPAGGRHHRAG